MFSLSVALDEAKGIGKAGILPWHIKEDLQLFKKNTLNKCVIMGKATYLSLPGKLKERTMMVVTHDLSLASEEVQVIADFKAFLKEHVDDETEYVICGGASIYRQAYPYCRKAYVSLIRGNYDADTCFAEFELSDWQCENELHFEQFDYCELSRKAQ